MDLLITHANAETKIVSVRHYNIKIADGTPSIEVDRLRTVGDAAVYPHCLVKND